MWTETETILRSHRLFANASEESVFVVARSAETSQLPSDALIVKEDSPAEHLFMVADGTVEFFACLGGRETSIAVLGPFAVFFIAPVVGNGLNPMSARTIEPVSLLKVPAFKIRALVERDAALARGLIDELAVHHMELIETLKSQKLRRSVQRVARYLLNQHDNQGAVGRIRLPVRKQTLASLLGITPSALSRAFTALKSHGVAVNGYEVELSKPYDLRVFANESAPSNEFHIAV